MIAVWYGFCIKPGRDRRRSDKLMRGAMFIDRVDADAEAIAGSAREFSELASYSTLSVSPAVESRSDGFSTKRD